MHITALCPYCRSAFQVQASLRGQMMRCPNASCRKVFAVPREEPPSGPSAAPPSPRTAPPTDNGQRSGAVGDMVPILPVEPMLSPTESGSTSKHVSEILPVVFPEPTAPAREERPAEADWWQGAPPVRQTSGQQPPVSPSVAESLRDSESTRGANAPPSSPGATWWRDAPPPTRNPQTSAPSSAPVTPPQPRRSARIALTPAEPTQPAAPSPKDTQQMPVLTPETVEQPRELPPGEWEPPPVRRGVADKDNDTPSTDAPPENESHQPRVSKRLARLLIVGGSLFTLAVLCVAGVLVYQIISGSEEALSKKARLDYGQGSYSSAAEKYNELANKFSQSAQAEEYRFLAKWCGVCSAVSNPDADPATSLSELDRFINDHKKDLLKSQNGPVAGQQLVKLATRFADRNANPPDEQPLKVAAQIEQLRRTVAGLGSDALTKEDTASITAALDKVRREVERASKRRNVLARLRKEDKETWMEAIKRVETLLDRMDRELPGLRQDAEAQTALAALYQGHLDSVHYDRHQKTLQSRDDDMDNPETDPRNTIVFAPLLSTAAPGEAPPKDAIVLALVRGVLYALNQYNGAVKWSMRVGIDTTVLPLHVPILSPSTPEELWLVLSADTKTVFALNAEGRRKWVYPIGSRVLGRPIIIDRRAYLAAYDGWIHEIELFEGKLVGRWYLGQPLTCGGAREGETSRLYFPAEDSCIYVLDIKKGRCETILYDGHRSGSLRSEPVIVPPVGENAPGYLILNLASGLDAMQLKVFELPLQDRRADPLLKPPPELEGWTWFEPYQDGEKLAILSDAGLLGLFGIRQLGNRDQPLFPLLQKDDALKDDLLHKYGLDLSPFLRKEKEQHLPRERGRSQVVHMQENDFWVLAHGRLQQVHVGWKETQGPQATAGWKAPLTLGSPLHESQSFLDRNSGRSTFYLVTQRLEQQTCLATKVDAEGQIHWQRQLGLVCQGAPLALTPPKGDAPMLLALDQGGGLFVLDPLRPMKPHALAEAEALLENPRVPPCLLASPDGHSAYEVAAPGDGRWLVVRRIEWANGAREPHVLNPPIQVSLESNSDKSVYIPAGRPAVIGTQLLIPMTDGYLKRVSLVEQQDTPQTGREWRDYLAPATASCHVLALGGDRFLATDGSRGLRVYEWPAAMNKDCLPLPRGGEAFRLEYPITSPPVLLPSSEGRPRIAVADSAGALHLLTVAADGSLQHGLSKDLDGKMTMGPFVYTTPKKEVRLGCVLDRQRLVWLDAATLETLWSYEGATAPLIGLPTWIDDLLVVASRSGHYDGLDPVTGERKGRYSLRTSAAPAAMPMPFDAGYLFTPLSDGTALRLSVDLLRQPAKN